MQERLGHVIFLQVHTKIDCLHLGLNCIRAADIFLTHVRVYMYVTRKACAIKNWQVQIGKSEDLERLKLKIARESCYYQ